MSVYMEERVDKKQCIYRNLHISTSSKLLKVIAFENTMEKGTTVYKERFLLFAHYVFVKTLIPLKMAIFLSVTLVFDLDLGKGH